MPTEDPLALAASIALEWGPDAQRPISVRLVERAPDTDLERAQALEAEALSINYDARTLAESSYKGDLGIDAAREELTKRHPTVGRAVLDAVWG